MEKFKQGDVVTWSKMWGVMNNVTEGVICGVATIDMAVLGPLYIIDIGRRLSDDYPYTHICLHAIALTLKPKNCK